MSLTIFNGSPRNKKSNSRILIEKFLLGYSKHITDSIPVYFLANTGRMDEHVSAFNEASTAIIIFPLYTDCMPGLVKEFLERLSSLNKETTKRVGFIVQSGFPESIQSEALEKYLAKFAKRQQWEYIGTVIKGGVEGIQIMPPAMTKKLFANFIALGEHFAKTETFAPAIVDKLKHPRQLSKINLFMFSVGEKLGLTNFYWNSKLKKNNAYNNRFAKPYANL